MSRAGGVRWAVAFGLCAAGLQACEQRVTAPGACPEFCPSTRIAVVDTIIAGAITADSTFRGFVAPHRAAALQLVAEGATPVSRGVVRFAQFSDSISTGTGTQEPILGIDSFRVIVQMTRRDSTRSGLTLAFYRLPVTIDSLTTLADIAAFFADSTRIATVSVPDTVRTASITAVVGSEAFPTFSDDGRVAAVGVALVSPTPTYLDLGSDAGTGVALLSRFVRVEAAGGETAERNDSRSAAFDTYLSSAPPSPAATTLQVGGAPSARSFLRINLPSRIVDSSEVSRATLILEMDGPVLGAPDDSIRVRADGQAAPFGPKSPLVVPRGAPEPLAIAIGTSGTVRLDVTRLVRQWRTTPSLPRVIVLRAASEGSRLAELRVHSSRSSTGVPQLQLTYVPLVAGVP